MAVMAYPEYPQGWAPNGDQSIKKFRDAYNALAPDMKRPFIICELTVQAKWSLGWDAAWDTAEDRPSPFKPDAPPGTADYRWTETGCMSHRAPDVACILEQMYLARAPEPYSNPGEFYIVGWCLEGLFDHVIDREHESRVPTIKSDNWGFLNIYEHRTSGSIPTGWLINTFPYSIGAGLEGQAGYQCRLSGSNWSNTKTCPIVQSALPPATGAGCPESPEDENGQPIPCPPPGGYLQDWGS